jgi:hypothetical protein
MPNIYVTDETKKILEKISEADRRTQDGEIIYLLEERAKQLNLPADANPSMQNGNGNRPEQESQG